jgi:hypothetical protein
MTTEGESSGLVGCNVGKAVDEPRLVHVLPVIGQHRLETIADLALAVIQDRGDAPFVWCHFAHLEYEGRTTFREFADGSVLALDTATGKWMALRRWDMASLSPQPQ